MKRKINRRQCLRTLGLVSAAGLAGNATAATSVSSTPHVRSDTTYETEILVCGGGPAGVAAATAAARLGRKVMILERHGRLGGMGVNARVFPLLGGADSAFLREVHQKTGGIHFDLERLDMHYADFLENAGAKILLHSWVTEPLMQGSRITGVKAISKQGTMTIRADLVIDATGDGDVAVAAGAPFEMGRDGDGLVQPMSIMFSIGGIADGAQFCGSEEAARVCKAGDETWEDVTTRAQKNGELPETVGVVRTYRMQRKGEAIVNATQINRLFGTSVEDLTRAELECRRQAYQVVDFMKKHLPGYENVYVLNMPAVIGVRETRRIIGLDYLDREDLISGRQWENNVVRKAHFVIDIHNPDGSGQAENQKTGQVQGSAARVKPFDIPLTCMIPKKVDGLLVAGRCISGSHAAHACYRVQNICLAMGEGVGTAAAIALLDKVAPVDVDIKKVQNLVFGRTSVRD